MLCVLELNRKDLLSFTSQPGEGMRPVNQLYLPGIRSRDCGTEQPGLSEVRMEGTAYGVIHHCGHQSSSAVSEGEQRT